MKLSEHLALWALRRMGLKELKPFMEGVYTCPNLQETALTLGPVIVLPVEFVKQAGRDELMAVMTHERGHQEMGHMWRGLRARLMPARRRQAMLKQMEFEADAYTHAHGFGPGLVSALKRFGGLADGGQTHPCVAERIGRLEQFGVPNFDMSDHEAELMTVIDSHIVQGIHGR